MNDQNIKSTIAVHTKNHSFRLAEGLSKLGYLDKIYSPYPRFKFGGYNIPFNQIKSFWLLGAFKYLNVKLGHLVSDDFLSELSDHWVSLTLKRPSRDWIFTCYNGFAEKSLIKAKKLGAVTLLERACPHVDEQEELLNQEMSLLLGRKISIKESTLINRMRREYDLADYIVVPSIYSQRSFVERGFDPSKVLVIPLCNEKNVPISTQKKYPSKFTVLSIGGNYYRKGFYYLLKAWEKLGLKEAKLIIKTEPPHEFEHIFKVPNVEIIRRHLSDAEVADLYSRASIFVLPSIDEGFGMVVIEAMRAGLPLVVTENVGAADVIHDGQEGFIVPIRDESALAEKISFFYKNSDKIEEMGKKAAMTAKDYTPEKYVGRVIDVYKNIFVRR